ncbi:MAG TPA: long-chain fatty acid transport protein [Cycloclasticus sp.]|jgi:long-chain fatty acid transport protein|nr:long-chain fatty acid transport protein [Cycloclasticus sp.]
MRTFNKTPLALGVAAGMAMLVASTGAQAGSTGTDLNLSAHTIAGGMAGAAYTRPQEASAAVFGNPATLTQFPGVNVNFGATLISLESLEVETDTSWLASEAVLGAGATIEGHDVHQSAADNYIVPTLGITLQVSPNLTLGLGLEADAGLGADYRNDPLELFGGALYNAQQAFGAGDSDVGAAALGLNIPLNGPVAAPLVVEVISFNANLAAGYKVTPALSLGGSLTIGFGLAQLGTAGPTTGFDTVSDLVIDGLVGGTHDGVLESGAAAGGMLGLTGPQEGILSNWGGSTSSVHDISFGWTLGSTYLVADGITTSLTVKSGVEYKFKDIIYGDPVGTGGGFVPGSSADGWQHLDVEQPLEVIAGVAFEDVLAEGLLVELDVIWKNWGDADAYQDAYEDQFLVALGAQYSTGAWSYRAGYSYAEDILKDTPNSTLGQLYGLGNLPLGDGAAVLDTVAAVPIVEALATDFIDIVQMSLLPVLYTHTVTAGIGYDFTDAVSANAFVSYSLPEEESRDLATANAAGAVGLSTLGLLRDGCNPLAEACGSSSISQDLGAEYMVGVGINIALP